MDAAHEWTEREINKLSRRIGRVYGKAHAEARKTYEKALDGYAKERAIRLKALDSTPEAKAEFDDWCRVQSISLANKGGLADQLAYDMTLTDVKAREIADGALPNVYARNYNHAIGSIEPQLVGKIPEGMGISFAMVDEQTVRKLITENPRLLPIPQSISKGSARFSRAVAYNKRQVTTAVTQGILQGESIPRISKRIGEVYGRGANAATRYARTACTCAENAGRLESYKTAEGMGIKLQKQWIATGDERTRDTHLEADGQTVPIDEPFIVGGEKMDEPGDPSGGGEAWNCRCTMRAVVDGIEESAASAAHAAEIESETDRRTAILDAVNTAIIASGESSAASVGYAEYGSLLAEQFESIDEVREMGVRQIAALTEEEAAAVNYYTSSAFEDINGYLRKGEGYNFIRDEDKVRGALENLEAAMQKSTLEKDYYAVRNTREGCMTSIYEKFGEEAVKKDPSILVGEVFHDKAYLSTTVNPDGVFLGRVKFNIRLPKGTQAIYAESASKFEDEMEMLVRSGQKFLIKNAAYENGRYEIWMEAIVQSR